MTPLRSHAAEKPSTSLTRPEPVSQWAMAAHFGLCSASAFSTISPVTDWPWGTSTMVTLAAFGSREFAASSSAVAALSRSVSPSIPEKVPLTNATTRSPGRITENMVSRPLQPVPATPKVWTFCVPKTSRSIFLHSTMPRSTSSCMWSATPAPANASSTRWSVLPGPGPAAMVAGISSFLKGVTDMGAVPWGFMEGRTRTRDRKAHSLAVNKLR